MTEGLDERGSIQEISVTKKVNQSWSVILLMGEDAEVELARGGLVGVLVTDRAGPAE